MQTFTKKDLKLSPIYSMSMCSLENFHTCFLSWLGQNYPKELVKVLTDKEVSDNVAIEIENEVYRGKNIRLDLQIKLTNDNEEEYVVVENKLKSFPTKEQLSKYGEHFKDKKVTFILLSLAPKFDAPPEWKYMSYSDLKKRMENAFEYKNSYDKYLIEDYIDVIGMLAEKFPADYTQLYNFYDKNELDEIGLKDIYVKYKTSELESLIKERFGKNNKIITYSDFHNKKGCIGIDYKLEEFTFGIQIEGMQYRYFAFAESKKVSFVTVKQVAEILFVDNLWFNNTLPPRGKAKSNVFCQYKTDTYSMFYRYKELNKTLTYQEIAKKVENDIEILHKNEVKIREIIKEVTS